MTRHDFIKAIDKCGVKNYKLRYYKKGKYGLPEAWIFNNDLWEKGKIQHGILIEEETIQDLDYLKSYLENCLPMNISIPILGEVKDEKVTYYKK